MEVKTYTQIVSAMRNYIIAHQDRLTDFNEGSVLSSQIEATARELAMLYIRCRVGFSSYLRSLPYSVFGFTQKEGLKASVKVAFSRAKPFSNDTVIPAETIVQSGGLRFLTTEAGTVLAGETESAEITASSEGVGDKYNVSAGTIKTIVSTLSADIVAVNNAGEATGGVNAEDWTAYISRFADYILGLSRTNLAGFKAALISTNLVRSVSIVEHFPPADGIWNMTVYCEDGSGGMTGEAITAVKAIIDGTGTREDGGYRAPGINVRYLTPEKVPVSVSLEVTAEREAVINIDDAAISVEIIKAVKNHINALEIGRDFVISDLTIALKRISYVYDVKITAPSEKTIITDDKIARFETCDVTVMVGGDE
ncbi:MAG: hypothetical protein Pg6C_16880 [Treponemataceae bacterium]|nr:MAG: hypothetical protein Pg6C_16880 [Treponemataceae bacterium]